MTPRPPLAPDLLGVIEQAYERLDQTERKLKDGLAENGITGIRDAKHILADARHRELEKREGAAA